VREEIDPVPERRNQRGGRETKRIGAILSIHMAGNRKGKKSDLNYEIMLF
jgi:hypothetical protein